MIATLDASAGAMVSALGISWCQHILVRSASSIHELESRVKLKLIRAWANSMSPTDSPGVSAIRVTGIGPYMFLIVTVFSMILQYSCAAALRDVDNMMLLNQPGVVGVWTWDSRNKYSPLSDFRNETTRAYYDVWLEDNHDASFEYPCEDRNSRLSLQNFTYSINGGLLQSLPYYDH